MKSYTSKTVGWKTAINNFLSQHRALKAQMEDVTSTMAEIVAGHREVEKLINRDLSQCDVLEIGHGQLPLQNAYFACRAKSAIGIDIDIVPERLNPVTYFKLLTKNGLKRTIKTCARELLGFNRRYRAAFKNEMQIKEFPKLDLRQGDVTKVIDLPDNSIDVVYSTDVFEHLSDPETAINEILRVLRPGGVVVTRTLHWANYNALHDIRVIVGEMPGRWAHLRPEIADEVQQGAYVNEIRIKQWIDIFQRHFHKSSHQLVFPQTDVLDTLKKELDVARQSGELKGFDDDELLAFHLLLRCETDA